MKKIVLLPFFIISLLGLLNCGETETSGEDETQSLADKDTTVVRAKKNQLDHIIWAVPDMDEGASIFEDLSGVTPVYGGVHPGRGTRNNLVSGGENTYFEIIAPDPDQAPFDPEIEPFKAFANKISQLEKPEVDMFVFSTPDLKAVADKARELGLEVVGPKKGSRKMPDGTLLEWTHVDFIGHDFGQFVPFAINWGDSPHPSSTSPKGAVVQSVTVIHPRFEELKKIYETLDVPAEVKYGETPVIIVKVKSDTGEFEFRSGPGLLDYYEARSSKNI